MIPNSRLRPLKRSQAKPYAAKAANVIGMTVAGMVTMRLFIRASKRPPDVSTFA
jgi:hypothetical protein